MADTKPTNYDIPGNYSLRSILLTNFDRSEITDIRPVVEKMVISESIMASAVHGYLEIMDTDGLHLELPIFGQEKLEIQYSTESSDKYPNIVRKFTVYKMGDKVQVNLNSTKYKLYFVSNELIKSESAKIQKSYRNLTISDIVKDVFSTVGDSSRLVVETTVNTQRIVVPFMSPFKTINWLSTFAVSGTNPNTSYLFFEDQSQFRFTSIDSLVSRSSKATFRRVPVQNPTVTGELKDRSIQNIVANQMFDTIANLSSGAFGSTVQVYDPVTRNYRTQTFKYDTDFDSKKYLEDGDFKTVGLYTDTAEFLSSDACRKFIITPTAQAESQYIQSKREDNEVFSKKREESLNYRLSQIQQLAQIKISVDVPGDSNLTCGDIIEIVMPSFAIETKQKPDDVYYSGRYLIQNVDHVFVGNTYTCKMILLKDSIRSPRVNVKSSEK